MCNGERERKKSMGNGEKIQSLGRGAEIGRQAAVVVVRIISHTGNRRDRQECETPKRRTFSIIDGLTTLQSHTCHCRSSSSSTIHQEGVCIDNHHLVMPSRVSHSAGISDERQVEGPIVHPSLLLLSHNNNDLYIWEVLSYR